MNRTPVNCDPKKRTGLPHDADYGRRPWDHRKNSGCTSPKNTNAKKASITQSNYNHKLCRQNGIADLSDVLQKTIHKKKLIGKGSNTRSYRKGELSMVAIKMEVTHHLLIR